MYYIIKLTNYMSYRGYLRSDFLPTLPSGLILCYIHTAVVSIIEFKIPSRKAFCFVTIYHAQILLRRNCYLQQISSNLFLKNG